MGFIIGEMSLEYKDGNIKVNDQERLFDSIELCQNGYTFLSRIAGPSRYMALNNLLYYSLMAKESSRADWLLEKAEDLLKAGQKHNQANLVLTACGVVLGFSSDIKKRDAATRILETLGKNEKLSQRRRNEAKHYLSSVSPKAPTATPG